MRVFLVVVVAVIMPSMQRSSKVRLTKAYHACSYRKLYCSKGLELYFAFMFENVEPDGNKLFIFEKKVVKLAIKELFPQRRTFFGPLSIELKLVKTLYIFRIKIIANLSARQLLYNRN